MWIWLRSSCVATYDTFLVSRAIQEFERLFGRAPFYSISDDQLSSMEFREILGEEVQETIIH